MMYHICINDDNTINIYNFETMNYLKFKTQHIYYCYKNATQKNEI